VKYNSWFVSVVCTFRLYTQKADALGVITIQARRVDTSANEAERQAGSRVADRVVFLAVV